ncbi:MAG: hypothetical protein AMK72_14825, partial [Planctomycetes bacterium SM23_25]
WLAGKVSDSQMLYRDRDFYDRNRAHTVLGTEATHVDLQARVVQTSDGQFLPFEKLLIATGGKPIIPRDVTGMEVEGVFTFTTWDEARSIRDFIRENAIKKAVVVGGGLIAQSHLESAGVEVRCGTTISHIEKQGGKVVGVALRDNGEIACSLVVLAIGVTPNTDIVKGTVIEVEQGIVVDQAMQTSVPGIYAAGDAAQAVDMLSGRKRPIPILPNAYRQGYIAGSNMAGKTLKYKGGIAMNSIDILGLPTISVGITTEEGETYEVVSMLDEEEPSYKKIVLKDDRVVGAIFLGDIDRAGIITGLIKEGIPVSSFKDLLLSEDFGVISLPVGYRKHVVSGRGIEV